MPRSIAVIPSRFGASRFPGKPLALLLGQPMVRHVWDRAMSAGCFESVVVATEDQRIVDAVNAFGGRAVMTSADCQSGTDRVAEVARAMSGGDDDVFVNIQGDEPGVHPETLKTLTSLFDDAAVQMATLVRALDEAERQNPNVVKVVLDESGHALYFSRADIPFARDVSVPLQRWAHLGLYGYRRVTLRHLAASAATPLERTESLEQLRALGAGVRIRCGVTGHRSVAVDVPGDIAAAEALLQTLKQ